MASTGAMPRSTDLVGRESERERVDELVNRAIMGEGGALVVRGDAGIGKSALLDHAVGLSEAIVVLRATGVEAEADLAFAGLYGLTRPILEKLSELPAVQATALSGSLGLAPSTDADRLLVSAALLGLLAAAAEDQPILCVVDDAQWLDRPSADALVFAARRLRGERVAILFAAREGVPHRFEATGLPEVYLRGLDGESALILLSRRSGEVGAEVRERLLAEAAGNPLALLELPSGLSDKQLAGEEMLPEDLPLTPRLQAVFSQRLERLPEVTQAALRIAAAEGTGDLATVLRAVAQSQFPGSVFDAAEQSDLIRVSQGTISFRHPLVRSALWEAATLNQRQAAHLALADALHGDENADRRVWHQAMATLIPDEEVAAALETSARRAQARAAHSSAASALLRAAQLSVDEKRRVQRIAAAAQAAWDAGQAERARTALARALPLADGELRARILFLSGVVEARCGSLGDAISQLLEAAELTDDTTLTLEILQEAGEAAAYAGQVGTMIELGERAESLPASTGRERALRALLTGLGARYSLRFGLAGERLAEVIREAEVLDTPHELVGAAISASVAGDLGDGLPWASRAAEIARRRGLLADLAGVLEWQATELLYVSRFELAQAAAEEGYRLSLDVGRGSAWHLANMATAEAYLGRIDDARDHADEAIALGRRMGAIFMAANAEGALALIDLTAGRPGDAFDRLLALTSPENPVASPMSITIALADTIEAAVRCGRTGELGNRYALLESSSAGTPTEQKLAVLARCQALLEVRPPEEAFEDAVARAHRVTPAQRARTELLFGEWLRRERRRQDARVHLRAAMEEFRGLGMRLFSERAEAELRATGETARKRDPSTLDDLTPQEVQIAGLVAQGLTNKEIAGQLFLSTRTIDYHLRKVFSKLGITSRTELVRDGLPARG